MTLQPPHLCVHLALFGSPLLGDVASWHATLASVPLLPVQNMSLEALQIQKTYENNACQMHVDAAFARYCPMAVP